MAPFAPASRSPLSGEPQLLTETEGSALFLVLLVALAMVVTVAPVASADVLGSDVVPARLANGHWDLTDGQIHLPG